MKCPECGSSNTQKKSILADSGTKKTAGIITTKSNLAKSHEQSTTMTSAQFKVFGTATLPALACAMYFGDSTAGIIAKFIGFTILFFLILLFTPFGKAARNDIETADATYKNAKVCLSCGHEWN
jgi:hypothetical protein